MKEEVKNAKQQAETAFLVALSGLPRLLLVYLKVLVAYLRVLSAPPKVLFAYLKTFYAFRIILVALSTEGNF